MSIDTRKAFDIPTLKNDMKLVRLAQDKPVTTTQAEDSASGKEISHEQESVYSA